MSPLYIARSTAVAARSLDGEMMIMSARDSTLFTLNPVGTAIWRRQMEKRRVQRSWSGRSAPSLKSTRWRP